VIVLLLAVAVAAGEGYVIGRESPRGARRSADQPAARSTLDWDVYPPPSGQVSPAPETQAITSSAAMAKTSKTAGTKRSARSETNEKLALELCPEQLASGVARNLVSLSTSEIPLLDARIVDSGSGSILGYILSVRNRTKLCIMSVSVSVALQERVNLTERFINKTVELPHPLAPGEKQQVWLYTDVDLEGDLQQENQMGLLKKLDLIEVRGFPAAAR
jgi:hypothetical protein